MYDIDKLIISKATAQTQEMITELNKNTEQLRHCINFLNSFKSERNFKGKAYDMLRRHLEDLVYALRAMQSANSMQISDCKQYLNLIGDEDLKGRQIFYYMDMYKDAIRESKRDIETFTAEINAGCNFAMVAYYRTLIAMCEANLVLYPKLLAYWQKKHDRFDEIQAATANLFSGLSELRTEIRNSLASIERQIGFREMKFQKYYDSEPIRTSIRDIWSSTIAMRANRKLTRDYFVSIHDDDNNIYYGVGAEPISTCTKRGEFLDRERSMVAAMMNLDLYLHRNANPIPSRYENGQEDYMTMNDCLEKADYYMRSSVALNKILRGAEKRQEDYEYDTKVLTGSVKEIAKQYGYENVSWETTQEISLEKIREQLDRNIPVLYLVGDNIKPYPSLLAREREYFDKSPEEGREDPYVIVDNTMVTITGIETVLSSEGQTETLLQISTEGKEYYLEYSDCMFYKENYLDNLTEEQAERYNNKGYNNISYIGY